MAVTKRNYAQIVDSGSWEKKLGLSATNANKLETLATISGKDSDGNGIEVIIATTNQAISSATAFANFPENSLLISHADSKIWVKAAAAGTDTWKYASLS